MTVDELQAQIRSFAEALARAMRSAEDAARTNRADKMMKASSVAKTAADNGA